MVGVACQALQVTNTTRPKTNYLRFHAAIATGAVQGVTALILLVVIVRMYSGAQTFRKQHQQHQISVQPYAVHVTG